LKRVLANRIDETWSQQPSHAAAKLDVTKATETGEWVVDQIRALSPPTDAQRLLRSRALDQAELLLRARWVVLGELGTAIPWPFLVVLVFWLTITFMSFGLQAPTNATVLAVLLLCALSVAGDVFLTLEMDGPFDGLIQVSAEPLRYALTVWACRQASDSSPFLSSAAKCARERQGGNGSARHERSCCVPVSQMTVRARSRCPCPRR